MTIVERLTGETYDVEIIPINVKDYNSITKSKFWFDWKKEKKFQVYKIQIKRTDEILGLISIDILHNESRIEIRLLAVSIENRGNTKKYTNIAGNLIAFAGIQSIKLFGDLACISLVPKTELVNHYKKEYLMQEAGRSLFLDGVELIQLIIKYDYE